MNSHHCQENLPSDIYGPAINECIQDDTGYMCVTNDEYMTYVRFCPFCGQKAENTNFEALKKRLVAEYEERAKRNEEQIKKWQDEYPPGTASTNMPLFCFAPNYTAVLSNLDQTKNAGEETK